MFRKICLILLVALLAVSAQAQLPAGINPAIIGQVTAACGAGILTPALAYGMKCLNGAKRSKKTCPSACKSLLAAVPNQGCVKTVAGLAQSTQAGLAKKMYKICKGPIAKIPK